MRRFLGSKARPGEPASRPEVVNASAGARRPAAAGAPALLAAAALATAAVLGHADPLEVGKSTVDGGGMSFVSAGSFVLGGTIGQPDAGLLNYGPFSLVGGFWGGSTAATVSVGGDPPPPTPAPLPTVLRVHPAAPNPMARATQLRFDLPVPGVATAQVYDLRGARVRTLIDRELPAGHHAVEWDGRDEAGERVGSGLYMFKIELGGHRTAQKVVVVR